MFEVYMRRKGPCTEIVSWGEEQKTVRNDKGN